MAKKKYYVVWEGRKPGVFKSWEACKESVHGHKGAKYKSFKTLELAKKAYSEDYNDYKGKTFFKSELTPEQLSAIGDPDLDTISVDAACSGNPGLMEYRGVDTKTKELIFEQGPFEDASNNIGEFLAIVHALALMKKQGDNRPIYTDSLTAMAWVGDETARSYIERTAKNKKVFELVERAENWLKENEYSNPILKWEKKAWGEIPSDFGRKSSA